MRSLGALALECYPWHLSSALYTGTGKKLGLWPEKTVATAILYTIRFFSAKSLARNDGFLVATAALFLAGKVENQPRHLNDVMRHCFLE